MTWLWPIFFSLLLVWPAAAAAVSGHVRLVDSLLPAVRKRQDYSGVVVWLEPVAADPRAAPLQVHRAAMEQKDKRFVPHILAVQAGTEVYFPNFDPIFHSAFSNFSGQIFDLGLYAPGTHKTIAFRRTGIVRVFCNIHPIMSGVIVVLKYPWFAVSDPSGAFSIPNVPPGEYQLHLFHERATPGTLGGLERRVEVAGAGLSLPPLTISETGYVEVPHKNKYGHDYPPPADDRDDYPAGRK
jgi:plastocyanin